MSDWRLELNGHRVEKLVGATFYKVTFPDFWEVAYREKNGFYQMIEKYAKSYIESTNKGREDLEDEDIQHYWHEHCTLCWEKAMTDITGTFYCTENMEDWICEECFNDFKNKYNWQAKETSNYQIKIDDSSKFYLITKFIDD